MSTTVSSGAESIQLGYRAIHEIADAAGLQFACTSGALWLTLDNDPRDVILEAGEVFFTTEHRRAIVFALSDASFTVRAVPAEAAVREQPAWAHARRPAPAPALGGIATAR